MFSGLDTGLRALIAYRLALDTSANNVANSQTPGYSRQRVLLSPTPDISIGFGLQVGTGVQASRVERISDDLLLERIRTSVRAQGRLEASSQRLSEVTSLFGDLDGRGIGEDLSTFFNSVRGLTVSPGDRTLRGSVLEASSSLVTSFRLIGSDLERITRDTRQTLEGLVTQTNTILNSLHEVNREIGRVESRGQQANSLRDQRDQILGELSSIIDIQVVERGAGRIDVLTGGRLILTGKGPIPIEVRRQDDGTPFLATRGSSATLEPRDGKLKALLDFVRATGPRVEDDLDQIARSIILEVNRRHSTGVGLSRGFTSLVSEQLLQDLNGSGDASDDLLSAGGLPFDIKAGDLYVNVVEESTGIVRRTRLTIDPETQTLRDLSALLSSVPNLSASSHESGRLVLNAAAGYRFDFSARVPNDPDELGAFGGGAATLTSGDTFPAAFTSGDSFTIEVDGGAAQTVTLVPGDFASLSAATAEELAFVINRDTTGLVATVVNDRLVLQSDTTGSTSSLLLASVTGDPVGDLGYTTSLETGSDEAVTVRTGGSYTSDENRTFRFEALGSGTIGETEGLQVRVLDPEGALVAILDVGAGYNPGDRLSFGDDLHVTFSHGEISADANDSFSLELVGDPDTADILPALGLNVLFVGDSARTIDISSYLKNRPDRLAASLSGSDGNGDNLLRILDLEAVDAEGLDATIQEGYGSLVSGLGFETSRAERDLETQTSLLFILERERQQLSGVSLDEEALNLVRFQQAFDAMTRYVRAIEDTNDLLLSVVG